MSFTEVWSKSRISDPKDVSADATEGGSIGVAGSCQV